GGAPAGGAPATAGTAGVSGTPGTAGADTAGAAGADDTAGSAGAAGAAPVDPCASGSNPCGAGTTCVARAEQASCECLSGYQPDPSDATRCLDIDECTTNAALCAPHSHCSNTVGAFECPCDSGYSGNGAVAAGCNDIDECKTNTSTCAAQATCTNTAGGFSCACPPDYSGDGQTCTALCAPAPAALAAWWTGDQDGTELVAGHNARLTSVANELDPGTSPIALAGAASPVKGGFDFSGSDWYATIADDPALDVGIGDFSIALWVSTTCGSNAVCVFLDKRDPSSYVGYSFYAYNGQLGFQMTDATSGSLNYNGGGVVTDGQWHFAVVSVARNDPAGMRFYVDNVLVTTANPTTRKLSLDNASELRLALRSVSESGQLTAGKLDEIQLYKQALGPSDVQALWNAGAHGVCK
ncbi:MAG TPA: EGF domain-containing protein, partial [Polyangiaceae bacterium]|nr:EGF domain-containing protein [Polyangiaceae bacterium]